MQPPVGASSWSQYSNASPPSYCARKGWKKIEEMAACPLERRLDSLSPPSLSLSLSSHLGPRRSSYVPHSHSFPPRVFADVSDQPACGARRNLSCLQQTPQVFTPSRQTPPAAKYTHLSRQSLAIGCIVQTSPVFSD